MKRPADLGVIEVYRDSDWSWGIQSNGPTGPNDLTALGSAWSGKARPSPTSTVEFTLGVDASQASTGLITISLTETQTHDAPDSLGFDVFAADSSGHPRVAVFTGVLKFKGSYDHA